MTSAEAAEENAKIERDRLILETEGDLSDLVALLEKAYSIGPVEVPLDHLLDCLFRNVVDPQINVKALEACKIAQIWQAVKNWSDSHAGLAPIPRDLRPAVRSLLAAMDPNQYVYTGVTWLKLHTLIEALKVG
jgi:hypothetical protein